MRPLAVIGSAALAATAPSGAARADVLEIGAGGAAWVAGGPRAARTIDAGEVTRAVAAAGPAAWRARVAALAAKYDVSAALIEAVVWQESRWRPGARSLAGARGLAQLMPVTARALGVDPADPRANLEGGARYLRQQLDANGGDLERALAAYNAGPGRVARARGVPAIAETRAYVAAVMGRLAAPARR